MDKHPITKEDPEERIRSLVETCAQMEICARQERELQAYEDERHQLLTRLAWATRELHSKRKRESDERIAAALADQPDEPGSRIQ